MSPVQLNGHIKRCAGGYKNRHMVYLVLGTWHTTTEWACMMQQVQLNALKSYDGCPIALPQSIGEIEDVEHLDYSIVHFRVKIISFPPFPQ